MNAPKEIMIGLDEFENLEGWSNKAPLYALLPAKGLTKYTRSDIVEALVKACNEHQEWLDKLAIQCEAIGKADLSHAINQKQIALSTALKALGE